MHHRPLTYRNEDIMSYTYINGYFEVTTVIRNGFKRFHSMNAQFKRELHGWDECYWFISYNTPIMWANYNHVTEKWHIVLNWESYDCSVSCVRLIALYRMLVTYVMHLLPMRILSCFRGAILSGVQNLSLLITCFD